MCRVFKRSFGVMLKWVANGRNHSQMAAGKVRFICGRFQAKTFIILSKLLFELFRKAHFIINKQFGVHQKYIT